MFQRSIFKTLNAWADRKDRKPLILRGTRQVGKTTAINIWKERFDQYLYFNLDLSEDKKLFERDANFNELLESLFFYKNASMDHSHTLIFIDEIQNVPKAVSLLRYFYEKAKDLHIITAGSLPETFIDRHLHCPVGRVEYLMMRPFSFYEFLAASEESQILSIMEEIPIPDYAHDKILKLFFRYTLIGGMPEIVQSYLEHKDIHKLKTIYDSLIISYMDDVEKYAANSSQATVLRHIIENAFTEAGNRITFNGFGKSNYRSREMSKSFAILEKAMLLHLVYPTTQVTIPASPDRKKHPKLQFLDTGLVNYMANFQKELFQTEDIYYIDKGKVAKHIVGQELLAARSSGLQGLCFWVREKKQASSEIDYVYPFDNLLIPIEVQSGSAGRLRSIHQFIDRAPHPYAVRLYSGPVQIDHTKTIAGKNFYLLNLPYYLVGKLDAYLYRFIHDNRNCSAIGF